MPSPLSTRSLQAAAVDSAAMDEALDFPNCDPVPMTWEQLQVYDGRIEYWDAALKTAWVLRDGAGIRHEAPCNVLSELLNRMALERGARIRCFGHAFLMVRDGEGRPSKIMCGDQTVYLDPGPFRHATDSEAVVIGSDRLPDVVLEVDHTTDIRRGKLKLYESWGFPEIWVETPDAPSPSRPRAVRRGLTIYLLEEGRYRESEASLAFPGWSATLDSLGAERAGAVGGDLEGVSAAGPDSGPGTGHGAGRRSAARRPSALGAPAGVDGGARRGSGTRAGGGSRTGRCGRTRPDDGRAVQPARQSGRAQVRWRTRPINWSEFWRHRPIPNALRKPGAGSWTAATARSCWPAWRHGAISADSELALRAANPSKAVAARGRWPW